MIYTLHLPSSSSVGCYYFHHHYMIIIIISDENVLNKMMKCNEQNMSIKKNPL